MHKVVVSHITLIFFCFFGMAFFGVPYAKESYPENNKTEGDMSRSIIKLSLDEAILLAVRTNPNVQSSQLSYVSEKFNLYIQHWEFYPHYSFQATGGYTRGSSNNQAISHSHNWNVQPGVSLLTPFGTQLALTSTNPGADHFNPGLSVQIMQPLMRGFGKPVVEAALNNANDTDVISRLNIEGVLRSTVTAVINAYLDVVTAERTMIIDEDAVKRAEKSVEQTKFYIKAGHKAGNELVTVEADVARAKTQLENDRNNLIQTRYAMLTAIGIDPNSNVTFATLNLDKLISKYQLPTLDSAKQLILQNDIQYQIDKITLHGPITRSLLIAKDNTRWQLNFIATASTGNGGNGGQNAGVNSLFNGANQAQSIGLTLQIPIDDQLAKQAVVSAKIAIKQAELALLTEKWGKETNAINGWHTVVSAERALIFAEDSEKLQEKTYTISYQKYLHGLIDSLELQSAQLQLVQSQQTLLSARINYLKSLVNLDLLTGNTLKTWNVKVRV
jgi:outer membrane protein TolC